MNKRLIELFKNHFVWDNKNNPTCLQWLSNNSILVFHGEQDQRQKSHNRDEEYFRHNPNGAMPKPKFNPDNGYM